jgi:hypothetical protein
MKHSLLLLSALAGAAAAQTVLTSEVGTAYDKADPQQVMDIYRSRAFDRLSWRSTAEVSGQGPAKATRRRARHSPSMAMCVPPPIIDWLRARLFPTRFTT